MATNRALPVESLFACSFCREKHKRCDRRMPCRLCLSVGKECVYNKDHRKQNTGNQIIKFDEKIRRNKNSRNIMNEIIIDMPTSTQYDLNRLSIVLLHTDVCFTSMSGILPLMTSQRIVEVITFFNDYTVRGKEEEALTQKPHDLEFALAFSNMGLAHVINGKKNMAQNMMGAAKKSAVDIRDLGGFESAACHAYFCEYYVYEGDVDRANYYLAELDVYLKEVDGLT
jgi:hypothetical protein